MLLTSLVVMLCIVVAFCLFVCICQREWGTLIFAALMFAGIAAIMIYGSAHTSGG